MVASNGQLFKEKTQKIPPKPTVLEVIPENIPGELKAIPNWMCWCYELRQNNQGDWKWTKPPLQVNSHYARSDQPRTWTTFERVWEHYVSPFGTEPNGIGFRPTGDIIGSDLDHCRDPVSGEIDEWAWEIIRLINSYTEISPSGTGIRIFCYGKLPPGRRKNGNVEMYDQSSPKYLTITGHHLPGTPRTLERRQTEVERAHAEYLDAQSDKPLGEREPIAVEPMRRIEPRSLPGWGTLEDIIQRASQAANGSKFLNLWRGNYEAEGFPSQSDADASLCTMLAFWTGPDPTKLDACFRESGLYRGKWDEQRGTLTYGERTIEYALSRVSDFYDWGDRSLDDEVHRICKPYDLSEDGNPFDWAALDPNLYEDCPEERPDPGELATLEPGLDLDHRSCLDTDRDHGPYLHDLVEAGVPVSHDLVVKDCPCCGLPGKFWVKDGECGYRCGSGKRTWVEARSLWRRLERSTRRGLKIVELFDMSPSEWLVDEHLHSGKVGLIYGPSGVCKSFYVLDMALSIATGLPFLGLHEVQQGAVVYIYSEGDTGLKSRLRAWLKARATSEPPDNIIFIPASFDLLLDSEVDEIEAIIRRDLGHDPALIVIDTLARKHGGDENASKDMNKYVGSVDRLKNTFHAAVLSVHHTGKDATKRGRGHTSLPAACDTIIELIPERVVDDVVQSVTVRCEKLKDAAEFKKYMLEKKEVVFGEGRNDKSLVLSPSAHEPPRPVDKRQEATERKRRARLYIATDVFTCCPDSEDAAASKKEITERVHDWTDRKSDLDPSRDWSIGVNKISDTIDWLTRRGHLARTVTKNNNHARYYKTTPHVDFFNLYGGEPTDEGAISWVHEMAEATN